MPTTPQPQSIDISLWVISIAVPALAGLFGVWIGSLLATRREQREQRLTFLSKQLEEFYSVLLGIRTDIRTRSEIRVKVQKAASAIWPRLCEEARTMGGPEALQKLTDTRRPQFQRLIEYDNKQLFTELLPLYRSMVDRFRTHYWLAEPETRPFYSGLVEFVEIWNRTEKDSVPSEVIEQLKYGEDNLNPFYEHLQKKHDEIREKVRLANV